MPIQQKYDQENMVEVMQTEVKKNKGFVKTKNWSMKQM